MSLNLKTRALAHRGWLLCTLSQKAAVSRLWFRQGRISESIAKRMFEKSLNIAAAEICVFHHHSFTPIEENRVWATNLERPIPPNPKAIRDHNIIKNRRELIKWAAMTPRETVRLDQTHYCQQKANEPAIAAGVNRWRRNANFLKRCAPKLRQKKPLMIGADGRG